MSISGLFALRYPPPIPCRLLWFRSPEGMEHPCDAWSFILLDRCPYRFIDKETFGSPKFPSYPFEYMQWSQTPVVSCPLTLARSGLLPSVASKTSAFPPNCTEVILTVHDYTYFGALYKACTLDPVRLRTPITGLALGLHYWPGG